MARGTYRPQDSRRIAPRPCVPGQGEVHVERDRLGVGLTFRNARDCARLTFSCLVACARLRVRCAADPGGGVMRCVSETGLAET